jgi:hypothetical protein
VKGKPMEKYQIQYLVRNPGAIGEGSLIVDEVEAESISAAFDAFRAKYANKFDFVRPQACSRKNTAGEWVDARLF